MSKLCTETAGSRDDVSHQRIPQRLFLQNKKPSMAAHFLKKLGRTTAKLSRVGGETASNLVRQALLSTRTSNVNPTELVGRFDVHKRRMMMPFGKIRQRLDFLVVFAILYMSLVVPFRLAFDLPHGTVEYVIDRIIDIIFIVDLVANFNTVLETEYEDMYDSNRKRIALRYIRTWFIIDFVSSVPFDLFFRGNPESFRASKLV
eukprot:758655_1